MRGDATIGVMRHRGLWRAVGVGTLLVTVYALWRVVEATRVVGEHGEPAPSPGEPTRLVAVPDAAPARPVEPGSASWTEGDGAACPATHPVKANLRSGIYHLPGGASYERTRPDRCYRDSAAAAADGLRASRR
jgi:hypothetical protein